MMRRQKPRRAWTLIELLVVMMCLSVLLSLLGSLMWAVFRIQAAATASFEQLQSDAALADRFRDDVAGASESPDFAADFQASPLCMILRGADDAFIVYRSVDNRIERKELGIENSRHDSYRIAGDESVGEFTRKGRLLTLTLRGPKRGVLTIAATMEGAQP
jgi:prepilin-type N-terminal cleavage/methylation domain-containing protein